MFKSYDELLELAPLMTVEELILNGFDPTVPDSEGVYVLNPVCRAFNVDFARQLIGAGADVNAKSSDGFTPLLSSIDRSNVNPKGALEIISCLLENGADIEGRGDWDKTPFLKSCTRGVLEVTQLLVGNGCDTHAQANEIAGKMDGADFANMPSNSNEFKCYINQLVS
ncbi:ankyrin repeat domain-containing protein [Microbulbifer sp. JMSA004]|uniref:ankyrin repeat domain-containing protein n=1 Tax=Microbulbifer sp. JMSA004 TaxID=3243370 RepID=UPI00403A2B02